MQRWDAGNKSACKLEFSHRANKKPIATSNFPLI